MIESSESLTVEFKSDRRCLSDRELLETVVCLANTKGGQIYLGVEDDGRPTGLHANHANLVGLGAMIANRTSPPVLVRVEQLDVDGVLVARIEVPRSHQIVATSDGIFRRRRLQLDGTPECVPFLPHEFAQRLSELRIADPSAQPVSGASMSDLDPVERGRLRQLVERFHGDQALVELSDEELDGALGLTLRVADERIPTLTGLLLIGKEASLRDLVPAHEVAFQVLEAQEVRFNEFTRAPLLRTFEWLETSFGPLNAEREIQSGLFRVAIPMVDRRAFREAIANALTHRDYGRLGAVHVRLEQDALVVSNPGGFVEGVTLENLLTTEPRPRNPRLADAFKRIGIVERTGRGVDLIYRGLLRFGRPNPDYTRSDAHSVVLRLPTADADVGFLRMVIEEEGRLEKPLPLDSLIVLSALRRHRRVSRHELADVIGRGTSTTLALLEPLVEHGLVDAHGTGRGRVYTLSAAVYRTAGEPAEYVRQVGFDRIQQEQMVLAYVREHGGIRRADVVELCRVTSNGTGTGGPSPIEVVERHRLVGQVDVVSSSLRQDRPAGTSRVAARCG